MKFRHQLAAYSPVGPRAVVNAFVAAAGLKHNAPAMLGERLKALYGADECVLCGSGTQALQYAISLAARRSRRDGYVALPAFNCYDMASAAIGAGVQVALYDVDPKTLAPDPDSFGRVLAAGASAAVVAYLYGVPFDFNALRVTAERYQVPLVEDAAQGHGASWDGVPLGGLGDISIISFGRGKGWTGGSGGAVLLRRESRSTTTIVGVAASNSGVAVGLTAQWILGRPALYGLPRSIPSLALGETVYHPPAEVSAMPDAAAAAALANESGSLDEAARRKQNGQRFTDGLTASVAQLISLPSGAQAGYIRYPVLLPDGMRSLPAAATALGVAASYPTTLAELAVLRRSGVNGHASFPGADRLARELVTVPTHSLLLSSEQSAIMEMIRTA